MRLTVAKSNMERNQDFARLAYSVSEVAKVIGISPQRVDDFIKNGDLAHFRAGTRVLVSYEMLLRFIKQRTRSPVMQNSREGEPQQ